MVLAGPFTKEQAMAHRANDGEAFRAFFLFEHGMASWADWTFNTDQYDGRPSTAESSIWSGSSAATERAPNGKMRSVAITAYSSRFSYDLREIQRSQWLAFVAARDVLTRNGAFPKNESEQKATAHAFHHLINLEHSMARWLDRELLGIKPTAYAGLGDRHWTTDIFGVDATRHIQMYSGDGPSVEKFVVTREMWQACRTARSILRGEAMPDPKTEIKTDAAAAAPAKSAYPRDFKTKAKDAAWRAGANQVTEIVAEALGAAIESGLSNTNSDARAAIQSFLRSPFGLMITGVAAGEALEYLPISSSQRERLAYELQVGGMATGMSALVRGALDPIRSQFLARADKIISALPAGDDHIEHQFTAPTDAKIEVPVPAAEAKAEHAK